MTDEQAPASRETDTKVAEAMGWKWYTFGPNLKRARELRWLDNPADRQMAYGPGIVEADGTEPIFGDSCRTVPRYSCKFEGWAAMQDVLAWIESRGMWYQLHGPFGPGEPHHAAATTIGCTGWNGRPDVQCAAPSLPLAVCRLALAVAKAQPEVKP